MCVCVSIKQPQTVRRLHEVPRHSGGGVAEAPDKTQVVREVDKALSTLEVSLPSVGPKIDKGQGRGKRSAAMSIMLSDVLQHRVGVRDVVRWLFAKSDVRFAGHPLLPAKHTNENEHTYLPIVTRGDGVLGFQGQLLRPVQKHGQASPRGTLRNSSNTLSPSLQLVSLHKVVRRPGW